jgi:hypothetical protein
MPLATASQRAGKMTLAAPIAQLSVDGGAMYPAFGTAGGGASDAVAHSAETPQAIRRCQDRLADRPKFSI